MVYLPVLNANDGYYKSIWWLQPVLPEIQSVFKCWIIFSIIINDEHCEEDDGQGEQEEFFPRSPALLKDIKRETDSWENIAEDFGQGEGRRGGGGGCEKEGGVWIFKTQVMHIILNCSKVH